MTSSRARKLRAEPTPAEIRLWRLLYPFRTGGMHFRKQAAIGPYIVDFVCHHARLVIEVDGDSHFTDQGIAHDATRDAFLKTKGFAILRFTNDDVMHNADGVFTVLAKFIEEQDA